MLADCKHRVAFHTYKMAPRGVDVACFDYAYYNKNILNNESIIYAPVDSDHDLEVLNKYTKNFLVRIYNDKRHLQELANRDKIDVFYAIKSGKNDGLSVQFCKNVIHAVFPELEPHGDKYACISKWLKDTRPDLQLDVVPHIVSMPSINETRRAHFNISEDAIVYGSMGGTSSFDIEFAISEIVRKCENSKNVYFITLGTNVISKSDKLNKRIKILQDFGKIIPLKPTTDIIEKVKFINTCDAMIHARKLGESFGLAIAEFSYFGKPIITCSKRSIRDRAHIEMLGQNGNFYRNRLELRWILSKNPKFLKTTDYYKNNFSPEKVMIQFKNVFLD